MSILLKKTLILWLSLSLVVFSPFSNALNFGNWVRTSIASQGSKTALGFRTSGRVTAANPLGLLYSGVTVNAKPSALAKLYKKVGPTAGFSLAVAALIGAVDYVLDPDNNRVIYTEPVTANPIIVWGGTAPFVPSYTSNDAYNSAQEAAQKHCDAFKSNNGCVTVEFQSQSAINDSVDLAISNYLANRSCSITDGYSYCSGSNVTFFMVNSGGSRVKQENVRPYARGLKTEKENYLSYEAIGGEVINNADSGSAIAQSDTQDAADPEKWTAPTYPYGNLEPEIEQNAKDAECDPKKDVPNSCYRKLGSPLKADPDGTVEVVNPDGTTTKYFPDGRVERSGAGGVNDGIKETTYPDGTKVRTYPDGTKIITKPDGTITTEEPAPPDPTVKDPDGTAIVQAPDGSITKYFPDGSKKTIRPDGSTTLTQPDGTVTVTAPNGDTTTTNPDGTKVTTKADGTKETDTEFKLPKFCDWAKPMCDLADTITEFLEPPDLPDREQPEEEEEIEAVEKEVDFNGQCPAPVSLDYSIFGVSINPSFSFKPVCDAATFINPLMHALGSLSAAYIFFGRGRQS